MNPTFRSKEMFLSVLNIHCGVAIYIYCIYLLKRERLQIQLGDDSVQFLDAV